LILFFQDYIKTSGAMNRVLGDFSQEIANEIMIREEN
jgi:hypothetical protein